MLGMKPNLPISFWWNPSTLSWCFQLRDPLSSFDTQRLYLLYGFFASIMLSRIADIPVWKLVHNGCSTVDFFYSFLNFGGLRCPYHNVIWMTPSPEKVKVFLQLADKNKLHIDEILNRKRGSISTGCSLYGANIESINHLILICSFVRSFWTAIKLQLK